MRAMRRLTSSGIIVLAVMFGLLASSGSGAPPSSCNVGDLQLRSSTVNQGLPYDRLVRGKETLVRLFLSLPQCAPSGASIQITGGTLRATGAGTTLASGITGTPTPVNVFPSVATYSTAALVDAPGDIKFVVPGSALAPAGTTASFSAAFRADLTFQYKTSNNAAPIPATKGFDLPSKTVEKKTNALRILVVPMGNAAQSYSSQFPASAVAAVENGMQTLSRIYPVPSGVGTLGGSSGGIRYAIDPTLLNVPTPYCGTGGNFDAIKAQLAQFLVSWNTANPTAQADRVVGAISSDPAISSGGSSGCAEGMASLISPEAWVRAFPDTATAPSMTGALFAMEIAHTFGLVPASRSYSTFHSLSTAADTTDPNRGYNVALRAFLADDHSAMKLSGAWNNNTTILEKADYAYLLCVLGGATNPECTTPTVVGSSTGVAALSVAYALTGHTDGTVEHTAAQESYVATELEGRGTDASSAYRLFQLDANGKALQPTAGTGVRVALAETIHEDEDDPDHEDSGVGTFAVVAPLNSSAQRFELRKDGVVLWSANKTLPPVITPGSFTATPGGARNFTNTTAQSENDPALTSDAQWVAYEAGQGITVAPTDSVQSGVSVPLPALDNGSIGAVVYSETNKVHVITDPTGTPVDTVVFNGTVSGIGGIADPEFSPDLTRIVFSGFKDGNRDIFSVNRFGGTPRRVTSDSRADVQPTWTAKGRIIFVRQAGAGGTGDLFSVRPDGTDEVRLTNDDVADEGPTASPDGDQVAWQRPESGWDIVTMNADGTGGMTNLTATTDGNALSPDWSADGSQIAFHLFFFPFGPNDTDVYTVGVDGGSPINVTATTGKPETNPLWAGDASALLYQTTGGFETISLEGSGGTVTPVSIAGASDWAVVRPSFDSPAWGGQTGDGAHLAYVFGGNLFVVPVDLSGAAPVFGEPVQIWSNSDGDEFIARSPTISNDDSTVVFIVDEYEDDLFYGVVTEDESYNFVDDGDNTGPYQSASFAHGGTDGEVLAVQIPAFGGLPEIWTSGTDLSASTPAVDFGSDPVISEGYSPAEGTDGRIAFGRGGAIWVWTPPEIEGPGTEEKVFDIGDNPALAGDTYAFERGIGTTEFPPDDIFIGSPGSGIDIAVEVMDDNAADNRLDLLVDCPGLTYVGAVALLPTDVSGASASWATNFDPSLTCENPTLRVAISDGYNRVLSGQTGEEVEAEQKGPTAAIYTPPVGSTFREYDVVPARGSGWDAEDGTLPDANLDWKLERKLPDDTYELIDDGEGQIVDFSPLANGFPLGDYRLTLTVADSLGNDDSAERFFTIVEDADNDGLTAAEEALGCITYDPFYAGPDQDPLNAFRDDDVGGGDGIPNVDDPDICTRATTYEATVDIDANMVLSQPLGVITGFVQLRYRPITAVNGSTVKIASINGITANIPALRWSVDKNGVGIAKFDKQAVIGFLKDNDIGTGYALVTISGRSVGNTWTFQGSDLMNVH